MLVRLTNRCLLLLVLYAHFCICNFYKKEKKRKESIITFQTVSGLLRFEKIGLFSILMDTVSSPALCQIHLNYVCLFIYLALIYFHPT